MTDVPDLTDRRSVGARTADGMGVTAHGVREADDSGGAPDMSASGPLRARMADIAVQAGSADQRADALLGCLPPAYAAAWIAVRDPETRRHRRIASRGDADALARYFALPEADDEVEQLGLNRCQPPVPASALPVPLSETRAWGEYLLPAGFRDGVAMGLFTDDGRHLGFVSLLTDDPAQRSASYVRLLAGLRRIFAAALDRLPSFAEAAGLTGDAIGGVVVTRAGRVEGVPGLPSHPLLRPGSPALAVARQQARSAGTTSSFLCPWRGALLRVRVLDCRDEGVDHLTSLVVVRPPGAASQLGAPELRLLGALVEGWDDDRIRTVLGVPDPPGSAAELAGRLGMPSAGTLVQHAAREGWHLPPMLWS